MLIRSEHIPNILNIKGSIVLMEFGSDPRDLSMMEFGEFLKIMRRETL